MKLLFFIPDISGAGGVEKAVVNIANYFSAFEEFEVTVLYCFKLREQMFYPLNKQVKLISLNHNPYPRGILSRIFWYLKIVRPLNSFVEENDYDIIFAEGTYLSLCLSLIRSKRSIRIGCEHIGYKSAFILHKILRRRFFRRLDALVVLTKNDQLYFSKFLKAVHLIPNFLITIPEEPADLQTQVIVSCGRLEYQKGFDLLISAFSTVHSQYPDWRLIIYGEGNHRLKLETLIAENKLEDFVELPGEISDVTDHLKNASVFVLSSRYEGFPFILLEAMSLGMICISYKIDGVDEIIIQNKNGILAQPNTIQTLGSVINSTLSKKELFDEISKEARETANGYRIDKISGKWMSLVKELCYSKDTAS